MKRQQRSQDQGEPVDDAGSRLWSTEGDENSQQIKDDCPHGGIELPRGRNTLAEASGEALHEDLEENRKVYTLTHQWLCKQISGIVVALVLLKETVPCRQPQRGPPSTSGGNSDTFLTFGIIIRDFNFL